MNMRLKQLPLVWKHEKVGEVLERLSPGQLFDTTSNQSTGTVPIVSQSEKGFVGYHDGVAGISASAENPVVTFANHTCAVRWHESSFSTIQNVFPLRGKQNVMETGFLYWVLKWAITSSFYGGHWPMLIQKVVPLPPIDTQRRIAAQLKEQLAAVEEARQAAKMQINELTKLANAIIRESLDHPSTRKYSLGDVLEEVKRGIGEGWANYPVLGATRDGLAPAKEPVGKYPRKYKPVFPGTVFYNPMRILIGSIAFVDENDMPGITSPDYVALHGLDGLVDSRWFYYWLRSPSGEQCISSLARGAVRERMLFNRLAEGEIELPHYTVQLAASQALAEIRPMKIKIEAQLKDLDLLPSRLLAQAFDSKETCHD